MASRDPYRYFRAEARELLDGLARAALDLEKNSGAERVSHAMRLAHTLKGAAAIVKQREISALAHSIEDALAAQRGAAPVTRAQIDGLFGMLDAISTRLTELPAPGDEGPAQAAGVPAAPMRAERGEVEPLIEAFGEMHAEVGALRRVLREAQGASHLAAALAERLGPRSKAPAAATRAMATELQRTSVAIERGVMASVARIDRELRQAFELTERLRLAPAGTLFAGLERVSREAAHSAGKLVRFEAVGGEVRLDSQVLEAAQTALVQLVRNAVAHGIEAPAERERAGKDRVGRVSVEISRHGRRVCFRCRDDGRGIDLAGVRRVLQDKGAASPDADALDAAALLNRLLEGGITTSAAVTELAGRGIGLDVVREVAARLGGKVAARTTAGGGTTIEMSAPISLASLEALIVQAGVEPLAIPVEAVRATLRLGPQDVTRGADGEAIRYQDRLIPLARLPSRLARRPDGAARNADDPIGRDKPFSAVVIGAGQALAALAVSQLRGIEAVTLRPLPELTPADPIALGAYIDAEGSPRPVLDPEALIDLARRASPSSPAARPEPRPILVIDDSLTTRMLEQSILEAAGYSVEPATSGEDALGMARSGRYGLFLVDVEMPGMDGFTFVERSRADPQLSQVPCVLVTSRNSAEDRRKGEAAGASAYIVKGEFDQIAFLDRVADLVLR